MGEGEEGNGLMLSEGGEFFLLLKSITRDFSIFRERPCIVHQSCKREEADSRREVKE
jgi:hypothetical protein